MIPLVAAFVAGVLSFVAPCSLPVLPVVLGGATRGGRARIAGVAIGFGATFLAVEVVAASTLASLALDAGLLRQGAAVVVGLAGLAIALPAIAMTTLGRATVGGPRPLAPAGGPGPTDRRAPEQLVRGLGLGAALGLIWAPCVAPLMAAVLAAAVVAGPGGADLAVAAAYVAGASVALGALALAGQGVVARVGRRAADRLRRGFGLAMVAAALAILTGIDIPLTAGLTSALARSGSEPIASGATVAGDGGGSSPRPEVALEDLGPAPELTGISAWLNSKPLTLAALHGKVVLVHFWTFACINCIHVQPYVKAWYARYADDGFVVVGVHSPELSFEHNLDNVRKAVKDDGVTFPVAFDPDFATWGAYHNVYWPAFYFIDKRGHIRYTAAGEGGYDEKEAVIRELLAEPA